MSGHFARWKPMDVAFGDNLQCPRRLVLEVHQKENGLCCTYTTLSERCGVGYHHSDHSLMTLEEFLVWVDRFSDEEPGRVIREAKEDARAPFVEPKEWAEFRTRYALTGDAFISSNKSVKPECGRLA